VKFACPGAVTQPLDQCKFLSYVVPVHLLHLLPGQASPHVNGVTFQEIQLSALATNAALAAADYDWRRHSLCRDTDPDLFFPVGTTGAALVQIDEAKAVCRICPVQADCLQFALVTNQDSGIWGGTSEEERRKLRRAYVARQKAASVS
jgi:WhiB family redox-sensing transcriptional regulator